ncbi:MAG: dTDP-4-dehydrorhamnose 3,5-epimerase family protein, partial [Phycisphaeraceae bacterium]|nr:dTDP-4-dehydrorhamnose 3,5-epimerase family protein [Phycisphaeraceae bacterium]
MKLTETKLSGVWVIEPVRHRDQRGFFSEVYRHDCLAEAGFKPAFVQDNHAENRGRAIVRGLHYQRSP